MFKPGGMKAVAAENLVLKKQLLVIQRTRCKAPNLTTMDRLTLGWLAMLPSPRRLIQSAIIIRPSTLLSFHKALVKRNTYNSSLLPGEESLGLKALIMNWSKPLSKLNNAIRTLVALALHSLLAIRLASKSTQMSCEEYWWNIIIQALRIEAAPPGYRLSLTRRMFLNIGLQESSCLHNIPLNEILGWR